MDIMLCPPVLALRHAVAQRVKKADVPLPGDLASGREFRAVRDKGPQPVENQLRALFSDPVPDAFHQLHFKVGGSLGIAAQQSRREHWVRGAVQPPDRNRSQPRARCRNWLSITLR